MGDAQRCRGLGRHDLPRVGTAGQGDCGGRQEGECGGEELHGGFVVVRKDVVTDAMIGFIGDGAWWSRGPLLFGGS